MEARAAKDKGRAKGKAKARQARAKAAKSVDGVTSRGIGKNDSKELAKWKEERDAERKNNGQPPFVPRVRPAYSLEPETAAPPSVPPSVPTCDESHADYEIAGVMQVIDDEDCDCIGRADGVSDADGCAYVCTDPGRPPPADEAGGVEIRAAPTSKIGEM